MDIPKDPFILVDGSAYLFRAYYALPPLTNGKGLPTGAIFGVANMLRKLLSEFNPNKIAVIFDTKEKTFRHDMFPEYKANRAEMPDDLALQIEPLFSLIKAMGLPLLAVPGVEADDVIGTLAKKAKEHGWFTVISTSDKDMAQLVTDNIVLMNTMTDTVLDTAGVTAKFGVGPELIIDYLSLIGDTVDNIPGIPKVGPKTALKWLQQYGNLNEIKANADNIKGKVGENLRENLTQLELYTDLVTINTNVELTAEITSLIKKPTTSELAPLLQDLGFNRWLAELEASQAPKQNSPTKRYLLLTQKECLDFLATSAKADTFALDTETTSLNTLDAELVGISIAHAKGSAYIPLGHNYPDAPKQLELNWLLPHLQKLLAGNAAKIFHNYKYDLQILTKLGLTIASPVFDTMLESYILNSTASRHDLDTLSSRHLNINTIKYEDVAGSGAKQINFSNVAIDKAFAYAAEDAEVTYSLHNLFWPELQATANLKDVLLDIDMPLVPVLAHMEQKGVLIDAELLHNLSEILAQNLTALEQQVFTLAGEEFNLNSPKQLQEILYDKLKLPILAKTPKGQPSTAEAVLQDLSADYELPKLILEYRSHSKLKSTYTDKLPTQINAKTGRVHTSYHQAVTATGRLSSSDPNLQNIPIRTEFGKKIREAFIAPPGSIILAADYSQIELRLMAHLSADPTLLAAFANHEDIHKTTAAQVFNVALDKVTSEQRRQAKAINFGLMYGMSGFGLAKQLGIAVDAANNYIAAYFERFPQVLTFIDRTKEVAAKTGFVETLYGRRLYLPDIKSSNHAKRKAAERAAINAPMQGGQADIIKCAMIQIDEFLQAKHPDASMLMQVHDELVFEIPKAKIDAIKDIVQDIMVNVVKLKVNLEVSCQTGPTWGKG